MTNVLAIYQLGRIDGLFLFSPRIWCTWEKRNAIAGKHIGKSSPNWAKERTQQALSPNIHSPFSPFGVDGKCLSRFAMWIDKEPGFSSFLFYLYVGKRRRQFFSLFFLPFPDPKGLPTKEKRFEDLFLSFDLP